MVDLLASAMASTGGPWQPCHTADIIGLLIVSAMCAGVLLGYCMGKNK